jgi:hypothetical protein
VDYETSGKSLLGDKMKIEYIFSRRDAIGSRFIAWGTKHLAPEIKDTPSHVAVLVDDTWIIESVMESGVRIVPFQEWSKGNIIVDVVPCKKNPHVMSSLHLIFSKFHKKYDMLGLIYFSLRIGMNKYFGTPLPKKNIFNHENRYFCVELVATMNGEDYQMTCPVQLLQRLKQ